MRTSNVRSLTTPYTTPPPTLFPYTTLYRSRPSWTSTFRNASSIVAWRRNAHFFWLASLSVTRHDASQKKCARSEEHTSELQSQFHLVCRLLLEKKNHRNGSYLKFIYYQSYL